MFVVLFVWLCENLWRFFIYICMRIVCKFCENCVFCFMIFFKIFVICDIWVRIMKEFCDNFAGFMTHLCEFRENCVRIVFFWEFRDIVFDNLCENFVLFVIFLWYLCAICLCLADFYENVVIFCLRSLLFLWYF